MLNETNTEQESTIELLISTLKEQYCRAERLMSLRDSGNHADEIKQLCADIELNFSKLMSLMKTIGADQYRIDEISKSNVEFDARSKDWMTKRAISATSLFRPSGRSLTSNSSSRSNKSTSSAKRQEAFVKLKLAKVEAKQAMERAEEELKRVEEDLKRSEREAKRKVELARAELEAWEASSASSIDERYDNFDDLYAEPLGSQATPSVIANNTQTANDSLNESVNTNNPITKQKLAKQSRSADTSKPSSSRNIETDLSNMSTRPSQELFTTAASSKLNTQLPQASWSSACGPSNIGAQFSQIMASNTVGPSNLKTQVPPSQCTSFNPVGLANVTARTKSLSPSGVKFRDEPVVNYSGKSDVMLNPASRNYNTKNVAGSFTTPYIDNQVKTIYDLDFAQSRDLRGSNFPYVSYYGIATSTANIENKLHYQFPESRNVEQAYFMPQMNQSYESSKPQLFRNSLSTVQDPYQSNASHVNAVGSHIYPPAETYFRQPFLVEDWFLPRPEFPKFDGDPLKFRTFMNNFERHVETKVGSSKLRLCYLIQHCEPKIQDKIQHFSNKGEDGYFLAKSKLHKEYGWPCVIADVCEKQFKNATPVKSNDLEALKRFAESLEKSLIILDEINCLGSLNSIDTMTLLVNKLPFDLRRSWVKESVAIENRTGRVADFRCLVNFVTSKSDELNSLFGSRIHGTKPNLQTYKGSAKTPGASGNTKGKAISFNVKTSKLSQVESKDEGFACFFCKSKSHKLVNCQKFQKASFTERSSFIKTNKFCYKCLSSKHRTPNCTRRNTCTVNGCTGTFHHTLLHPVMQTNPSSENSAVNEDNKSSSKSTANDETTLACSLQSSSGLPARNRNNVYLCVVPVNVKYKNKSVRTYAFLDHVSTRSFCDKKLFGVLGASGTEDELMLQTLTDSKAHRGFTVSFTISALKSDEEYALSNVFCIPSIPVTPNLIPAKTDLDKLTYLRDIEFPQVKNATVTLLIGADCPEMFCVSEMRKGARGQPVAIKTPLGWSLLGPSLSLGVSKNCQVNFVKATDTSHRDISCLWENDFGCGTSVLDVPSSKEDRIVYESMQKTVTIVDGHYQLPLPWRDHVSYPGDSLPMAQRRLLSLQKRLQRDKKLHYQYSEVIETYVKNDYARAIPNEELDVNSIT